MSWTLFVPFVAVLAATVVVPFGAHRLRPAVAAWTLTALLGGCIAALAGASVATLLGALSHWTWLAQRANWCVEHIQHRAMPGLVAPLVVGAMVAAAANVILMTRRQRRGAVRFGEEPVVVLPLISAIAYALPGRPGQVVVSTGMLDTLEPDERRVLFAHELAHLRLHHHRFLRLGELTTAVLPLLRPVQRRLVQAVERWADEDAAIHIGDRHLVARTITKAALATDSRSSPQGPERPVRAASGGPDLNIVSGPVNRRVAALLTEPGAGSPLVVVAMAGAVLAIAGATVQIHHLATYAVGLC